MKRAERIQILAALQEAENALLDYVERLEKKGGTMGYGRAVIRQVRAAAETAVKAK